MSDDASFNIRDLVANRRSALNRLGFLYSKSAICYESFLIVEVLRSPTSFPPDPLDRVFPNSMMFSQYFTIIELCKTSSVAKSWSQQQRPRICQARYMTDVQRLFLFSVPIPSVNHIFYALRGNNVLLLECDSVLCPYYYCSNDTGLPTSSKRRRLF